MRTRIGLVSDTHIPEVWAELPPEVTEALRDVDLILHAGDIYVPRVLDDLERIAPVLAAEGDDDDYRVTLADKRVKKKHILKLEGQTLWLVLMRPFYLTNGWCLTQSFSEPNKDECPDIVVFGHEHCTAVQHYSNILFINPLVSIG